MINPFQSLVQEFHGALALPIGDYRVPALLNPERMKLRADLVYEEVKETLEAVAKKDLVSFADGLGDVLYVDFGAAVELGIELGPVSLHPAAFKAYQVKGTPRFRDTDKIQYGLEGWGKKAVASFFSEPTIEKVSGALSGLARSCMLAAADCSIPLWEVFQEIHRSNMRKVGGPIRADGKRLKPEGWVGPDIASKLREVGWAA